MSTVIRGRYLQKGLNFAYDIQSEYCSFFLIKMYILHDSHKKKKIKFELVNCWSDFSIFKLDQITCMYVCYNFSINKKKCYTLFYPRSPDENNF